MLDGILCHYAFAADDGDALGVGRTNAVDDLVAFGAWPEEHAEMQVIAESGGSADCLDAVDDDAVVGGLDDAQGGRVGVGVWVGAISLRVDEMRRNDEIVVHRVPPEIA